MLRDGCSYRACWRPLRGDGQPICGALNPAHGLAHAEWSTGVIPRDLEDQKRETGQRYAIDDLVRAGTRAPMLGEDRADWLNTLERTGFLTRRRHPGNHVYLFAMTQAARIAARQVPSLPYPVLDRTTCAGDVTALPLLGLAA